MKFVIDFLIALYFRTSAREVISEGGENSKEWLGIPCRRLGEDLNAGGKEE